MSDSFNIETSTAGPPKGVSRRGRWTEVHLEVQKSEPGEWIVVKDLQPSDAASLRSALKHTGVADVATRVQEDGTVHVWTLREPGRAAPDPAKNPDPAKSYDFAQ